MKVENDWNNDDDNENDDDEGGGITMSEHLSSSIWLTVVSRAAMNADTVGEISWWLLMIMVFIMQLEKIYSEIENDIDIEIDIENEVEIEKIMEICWGDLMVNSDVYGYHAAWQLEIKIEMFILHLTPDDL